MYSWKYVTRGQKAGLNLSSDSCNFCVFHLTQSRLQKVALSWLRARSVCSRGINLTHWWDKSICHEGSKHVQAIV